MIDRFRRWQFSKVARKTSIALKEQHGPKPFYSAAELDEVIRMAVGYRTKARIYPIPTGGTGSVFEG